MNRAIIVLGPTAAGKSRLALEMAQMLDAEIISLDSVQVYRGLNVGSAKPSDEERRLVRHHLIDIVDPDQSYNAARFREDCERLVGEICGRGRIALICGGTMMYYKTLTRGMQPIPASTPEVRAQVTMEAAEAGWEEMHRRLKDFDPEAYVRLSPGDRQRISRAHEVYRLCGRSISSFYSEAARPCSFERCEIVLLPEDDRLRLRAVIRKRFAQMLDDGLIAETEAVLQRYGSSADGALRAVGYRQAAEFIRGEYDRQELLERGVIATARLAKHQMTWLRGGLGEVPAMARRLTLNPDDPALLAKAMAFAKSWLSAAGSPG